MSHFLWIYIFVFSVPTYIYAATCTDKTVGGTSLDGGTYTELDTETGAGYLAKTYVIDCCGLLAGWNVKIAALGTINLQIWRPSGTSYTLVHTDAYTFTTNDALAVQNLPFSTSAAQFPAVLENDVIGWYTSTTDMIEYDPNVPSAQNRRVASGANSGTVDFDGGTILNGRGYAVNAIIVSNPAPTFSNLPAKISFLDTKTVSTAVSLFTVTETDNDDDIATGLTVEAVDIGKFLFDLRQRVKIRSADYEVGEHNLVFSVTDQCGSVGTYTLTICVNNTDPVITNTQVSFNIKENLNVETQITQLTVTDEQDYTCTIDTVAPDDGTLVIKQTSATSPWYLFLRAGQLYTLDHDTKGQYIVDSTCTDIYGAIGTKKFYVNVERNEEPVINALPLTVQKSTLTTGVGDTIYQVDVTDTDTDASKLTYAMSGCTNPCPFDIDTTTGLITANTDLNLHKVTPYELDITVTDEHRDSVTKTLKVELTDINDQPVISNLGTTSFTATIDENIFSDNTIGRQVYDVDFTDDDTGDTHTFSATFSSTGCSNLYEVDSSSGVVTTKTALDYETLKTNSPALDTCDVIFTVDDGRETSVAKKLRIVVTDVNEQQIGFQESTYTIVATEGSAGTILPDPGFAVTERDLNDPQTYTMDCGAAQSYLQMNPTNGAITQLKEYDLDAIGTDKVSIPCTVTASDQALPTPHTVTTDLVIEINEINDNDPEFDQPQYLRRIAQNTPAGTTILRCGSSDADFLEVHQTSVYSVSNGDFGIDNDCNVVTATDMSKYSVGQKITFPVTVRNKDDPTRMDTTEVTVIITEPTTTTIVTTIATVNNANSGTGTGDSGDPAPFLENPANLAWFIPAMLALAAMLGLAAYMIYRCCRVPGFCARLFSDMCGCCNNRDCFGRSRGHGRITDAKSARNEKPQKDKAEPRQKSNKVEKPRESPRLVKDPDKLKSAYEWNLWGEHDWSNPRIEHR